MNSHNALFAIILFFNNYKLKFFLIQEMCLASF